MTFKVAVQWIMTAEIAVEAETLDEAIKKAKRDGVALTKGDYVAELFGVEVLEVAS